MLMQVDMELQGSAGKFGPETLLQVLQLCSVEQARRAALLHVRRGAVQLRAPTSGMHSVAPGFHKTAHAPMLLASFSLLHSPHHLIFYISTQARAALPQIITNANKQKRFTIIKHIKFSECEMVHFPCFPLPFRPMSHNT